jgi:hypothetical protein
VFLSRRQVWTKALVLAPFLLFVVSLPGQVLLRCRFDGQLRTACCCPADQMVEQSTPPGSALADPCCCQREVSTGALPALAVRPPTDSIAPAVAVALPSFAVPAVHRMEVWVPGKHRRGPPREGARIIVLKQSFLI